jgi:hypothetical protein
LGVLPGRPIGKRRAAPDSELRNHRFRERWENTSRREFSAHIFTRQIMPRSGNFCPAVAANISTLTKRHGAFVGKIPVNEHA